MTDKKNYEALIRRSVKRDFVGATFKKLAKDKSNVKRVAEINEGCYYFRYRKYFVGKLVHILPGNWVRFIHDSDRRRINEAAGWSDAKCEYLLDGVKFE